jgi:hypothetical protein
MPIARSWVGTSSRSAEAYTVVPLMPMRPSSAVSRPATQRSVVVLPQPEGPTSEKNSCSSMAKPIASTAVMPPKRLVRPSTWMVTPTEPPLLRASG